VMKNCPSSAMAAIGAAVNTAAISEHNARSLFIFLSRFLLSEAA
jgi:hypothetical protein